jgi:hypothetical protein
MIHFFMSLTFFIGFIVVYIFLVESSNKRSENVFFFVGINCCVIGYLTIYFYIEVEESPNKRSCFFFFLKPFQIMIGLFFLKQTYIWRPYSIGKKLFQLIIKLFFLFLFSNKLIFVALFHWKKPFQIIIRLFFLFSNKLVFGALFYWKKHFQIMIRPPFFFFLFLFEQTCLWGLIPLRGLRRPPNSPYG